MHKIFFALVLLSTSLNQLSATFYDVSTERNYKKASELFSNQIKENLDGINVLMENREYQNDLEKFNLDLDKIVSDAMNKFDEYLEFGEDQKLLEVIGKADEDDMDGEVEEE
jgi:hypothetical protein